MNPSEDALERWVYREIIALRPEWQSKDDAEGAVKVVITGSAPDPSSYARSSATPQNGAG